MSSDLEIQRLGRGISWVLAVPSWGGFIYTLLHRPVHVSFPSAASLPGISWLAVLTLACSLLCFVCALPTIKDNETSFSTWIFVAFCAVPFFGMLGVLDPFDITSIYI